jgi:ribosomal protein L39E
VLSGCELNLLSVCICAFCWIAGFCWVQLSVRRSFVWFLLLDSFVTNQQLQERNLLKNKKKKKKKAKTKQNRTIPGYKDRRTDRQTDSKSERSASLGRCICVSCALFLSLLLLTVCLSVCVFCVDLSSVFLSFAVFVVIRCYCAAPPSIEIFRERLRLAAAGGRRGWLLLAFCCSSIVTFQDATLQRTPQAWQ